MGIKIQDVISIAGAGMGKTLTFWMPLLFRPLGILLVVTPLNILGKQNVETLEKAGIDGIFISAGTAMEENFRAIAAHCYRVIVVNPEELMRPKGGFERLMKDKLFVNSLIGIVIDESRSGVLFVLSIDVSASFAIFPANIAHTSSRPLQ